MMIFSWLNATKNLWLIGIGVAVAIMIYVAGGHNNELRTASEVAAVNVPIAEQRGEDTAQMAAEDAAGKKVDAVVSGAISQACVLTEETAKLLASVR